MKTGTLLFYAAIVGAYYLFTKAVLKPKAPTASVPGSTVVPPLYYSDGTAYIPGLTQDQNEGN